MQTNMIEIILPDGGAKPVMLATRNGKNSYISPAIVERCGLRVDQIMVSIELRWRIEQKGRVRSFLVPDCVFQVKSDLETDLAIGRGVLEKLKNQTGSAEDSYDLESSSEDEGTAYSRLHSHASMLTCTKYLEMAGGSLFLRMRRHQVTPHPVISVQKDLRLPKII
jgi:hypothetical protein